MRITATYSPEDNKLRLYASQRLDSETYARVKAAGFKWAPKQELFVAPMWTCAREDLCIELAGEIEAEESTMAERAEAKAERLEALADKRRHQANAFSAAAHRISERFAMGQPILIGHHSERRARKDRERADSAMRQSIKASEAVGYWLYKASAAQHHANAKNSDRTRANRIKTLLAELRDLQRKLNHAELCLDLIEKVESVGIEDEQFKRLLGQDLKSDPFAPYRLWCDVDAGRIAIAEAKQRCIQMHQRTLDDSNLRRWIEHTLNRLSYERELLGPVARFEGELTPVMLQEFAREHGAHKPEGNRVDDGRLSLSSRVPLPAHIGDGCEVTLTADEWRDLMQSCGYDACGKAQSKAKSKSATIPLLNIRPECGPLMRKGIYGNGPRPYRIVAITKAEFQKMSRGYEATFVVVSDCGRFRFRIGKAPGDTRGFNAEYVALFISDSKAHDLPAPLEAMS